jgi:hypothetical protein
MTNYDELPLIAQHNDSYEADIANKLTWKWDLEMRCITPVASINTCIHFARFPNLFAINSNNMSKGAFST